MRLRTLFPALVSLCLIGSACGGAPDLTVAPSAAPPQTQAPRLSWAKGPAGKLRVDDGGLGGVPVVLVHGLAGSRTVWTAQLEHLRKTRRAIALDLRGAGESDPAADGDYSIAALAADVGAVIDELGLSRIVLVGHSLGGAVIGAYGGAHPEQVAGLLFVDPVADSSHTPKTKQDEFMSRFAKETYNEFREKWYAAKLAKATPAVKETVMAALRSAPREIVVKYLEGMMAYDPIPPLKRYSGPKFVLFTEDHNENNNIHNVMPGMPSKLVPGVSHWLMMDQPDAFNRIMDEFLTKAL